MNDGATPGTTSSLLPLLSFGTGAADAFAFTVLGGIFTANMTGNAVLAVLFDRSAYLTTLAGAATALAAFVLAALSRFRMTRAAATAGNLRAAMLMTLGASAICLKIVLLLWWFAPHARWSRYAMITFSSAAMAFQTVAAKRDGLMRGFTTTYLTGALTELIQDIAEGKACWTSTRWLALMALPVGAATAVAVNSEWPALTPALPLATTVISMALIARRD